ncbi:sulfotransferase domain-containing protein [Campylobacter jejuni]|nr:sulfotransferase domain-containing protein [Campylobacter jejuni]
MTAYVHIGTVKTGTTTIQKFLLDNTLQLEKLGFSFLKSFGREESLGKDYLLDYVSLHNHPIAIDILKKAIEEETVNQKNIILSSEGIHATSSTIAHVKRYHTFLKKMNINKIKIIIYIRDPAEMAVSLYTQIIKHNYFKDMCIMNDMCKERFKHDCNYKTIKLWSEVFGKENIIVKLFDKNEFYQGDLLKDFINTIDLEWDNNFIIPNKLNESIDLLGTFLLSKISKILRQNNINQLWYQFCKHFISKDLKLKFQPPKEIYQSYIDYFEESNEWVRKEFFPHKERLFPKKDMNTYKENYELKEMKPEYWDKIAEFIADIIKTNNNAIQKKDNQISILTQEKQDLQNKFQNELNSLPVKKQHLELANLEQDLIIKKLESKKLAKSLRLKMSIINPKITFIQVNSAKSRIHNHLSYKLGQALIENSKSILGYIRIPFVLSYIKDKHKFEQKAYEEKIKENPNLALPPLETYPDYNEALKEKECFTYKLGEALMQANKNWYGGGVYQIYIQRCA